ncbi:MULTISPECIES: hypothetical protein [Streptomyces]|uniref:hypothetical protein n=2 Tax=Streptomyces TaxID=1883 RepID=UPI0033F61D0C
MDSTETARRLLGHGAVSRPYAQLTGGHVANTPIYAELVAEWRAKGHTVPGHREGVWASFAVVTVGDRGPAHAVPFRVPVPLLAAGAWEGEPGGASEETPEAKPPDETSGEGQQAAPEGKPSPATRGTTPSGKASEDMPGERPSHGAPEVVPSRERPRGTPEGTSEASLPEETRGTVPSGGTPEAGSEEPRSRGPSEAMRLREQLEETSGGASEEAFEGSPFERTRGTVPFGGTPEARPEEPPSRQPSSKAESLREPWEETSGGTSEVASGGTLPEDTRGTVPSGGAPEAGSEESRSPETPEAAVRTPSWAVGGRASSEERPGTAAQPRAAVPEQAPEPGVTSSPDSAPR